MGYVAAILVLLALAVSWLIFRAYTDRSYVKGHRRRAPEPDGHIDAEERLYAEQMKIRFEYYQKVKEHPPDVRLIGETIACSDDFAAAEPIFAEFRRLSAENPPKRPLGALAVLKDWDYRAVWFLDGLSDIAKAAIYEQSAGKTIFLPEYGVIVARAGDTEGFLRAYCEQGMNS
jgi:hypothetical protein